MLIVKCEMFHVMMESNSRVGEIYMIIGRDISKILEILMVRVGGY